MNAKDTAMVLGLFLYLILVGAARFELATPRPQNGCATTAPRPDRFVRAFGYTGADEHDHCKTVNARSHTQIRSIPAPVQCLVPQSGIIRKRTATHQTLKIDILGIPHKILAADVLRFAGQSASVEQGERNRSSVRALNYHLYQPESGHL